MEKLFAYGTLRDCDVQQQLLGRTLEGRVDELADFELFSIRLGGNRYPMIRPRPGALVSGLTLDVHADELSKLDEYETTAYARSRVTLKSGEVAWVYHEPPIALVYGTD